MLDCEPGMETAYIPPEIAEKIFALERTLIKLCRRYLDGCNSVYAICFDRVSPPDTSLLEQNVELQKGIQDFLAEMLGGPMRGFAILDQSKADIVNRIGAIPSQEVNLMDVFLTPILAVLQELQADFYTVTDEGELYYRKQAKNPGR